MNTRHAAELDTPDPGAAPANVVSLRPGEEDFPHDDLLAVEAPLEVRIGGRAVSVLMRTPGHDAELVAGWLFSEGVIADADDILSVEPAPERANVLDVRLCSSRRPGERLFFSNSSCGVCGKQSLESVEVRGPAVESELTVSRRVLCELPDRLRAAQPLFARTGGAHASALFTPSGELVAVREDVGRHNALDKLVGWALAGGRVPLSDCLLLVSGRLSYELVQKAIVAGIPLVAAVGAPSSLAAELAARFGVTLVGFLRPGGMNAYARPARVTG
jgi:FdhD protein